MSWYHSDREITEEDYKAILDKKTYEYILKKGRRVGLHGNIQKHTNDFLD